MFLFLHRVNPELGTMLDHGQFSRLSVRKILIAIKIKL